MRIKSQSLKRRRQFSAKPVAWFCAAWLSAVMVCQSGFGGVTPESPEVLKLIASALAYLERPNTDANANLLGGKCLVGLAFLKAGHADHARVKDAIHACAETVRANPKEEALDVYSNGLAIIFLCEVSSQKHAREIEWFLAQLKARQKPHGGWGYFNVPNGDTSQTQYGALSYWEANRRGFGLDGASVDNLADWLLRTQGPDGCWGYQGVASTTESPIEQDNPTCSMLAAGLGSLYICADLFGIRPKPITEQPKETISDALPAALRPVDGTGHVGEPKRFRPQRANPAKVASTMQRAHAWMDKNYKIAIGDKAYYYLYAMERYRSFQEAFESTEDKSPKWYNDGYEFLVKDQGADGSWTNGHCGPPCDTAFSVLFLLRSTQKSIHAKLGEGMLLAGRGLPTNLSKAKLRNGQLLVEQTHTKVDELLSMIDDGDDALLDDLARDPSQLVVEQVDEKSARRLQQLVRGGEPEVRMLAVRALGRTGNLDYVPSLLYALTDPDRRIVVEARNELRFISRNFDGLGPPDDFTDQQRFESIDAWKKWYLSIRPGAVLEK